jgi:hypothetical protein
MKVTAFPLLVVVLASYGAAKDVGDSCGAGSDNGVCESTTWCNGRHGTVSESGLCPGTPTNVRCCYYPDCSAPYSRGFCKFTWDRDGAGVACWGSFVRYVIGSVDFEAEGGKVIRLTGEQQPLSGRKRLQGLSHNPNFSKITN